MRRRLRAARVPDEGGSSPARIFSSVDLPEPFGPDEADVVALEDAERQALEERRRAEGLGELLAGDEQLSQRADPARSAKPWDDPLTVNGGFEYHETARARRERRECPRLARGAAPPLERGRVARPDRRGRGERRRGARRGGGCAADRPAPRVAAAAVGGAGRSARLRRPLPRRAAAGGRQAARPAQPAERRLPGAHAAPPRAPAAPGGRADAPARARHLGPAALRADARGAPRRWPPRGAPGASRRRTARS